MIAYVQVLCFIFIFCSVLMCRAFFYWNSGTEYYYYFIFWSSSSSSSVFKAFSLGGILFQNLFRAVPGWNRKLWHGISVFGVDCVANH